MWLCINIYDVVAYILIVLFLLGVGNLGISAVVELMLPLLSTVFCFLGGFFVFCRQLAATDRKSVV